MREWLMEMAVQAPIAAVVTTLALREFRRMTERVEGVIRREGAATRQTIRSSGCALSDHRDAIVPPAPRDERAA